MQYLIGVGTYAAKDDSIGLRIAEAIAETGMDRSFRAVELGGSVLDLVHYLDEDAGRVLIVDSAKMGAEPGEYRLFGLEDIATRKELAGFSTHEGDVMKVLELARSLGRPLPAITFLGVEPAELGDGMELSATLQERFGEYVDAAVAFFGE